MSVYIIVNLETEKAYVGQTRGSLETRFKQHCEPTKASKSILSLSIQKHGVDSFYMESLWESPGCSQEQLDDKEIELIREYNTQAPSGYNITAGGGGVKAPTEETRNKMSESARRKFIKNPELRSIISRLRSVEKHTEERRKHHSETMKRKYKDEEFRVKMKKSREGSIVNDIVRENRRRGLIRSIEEHPERFQKIHMFNKDGELIQSFTHLADTERSGLNRGSVVRCIKSGKLFKKAFYFSYSSTLPPVSTTEATEERGH